MRCLGTVVVVVVDYHQWYPGSACTDHANQVIFMTSNTGDMTSNTPPLTIPDSLKVVTQLALGHTNVNQQCYEPEQELDISNISKNGEGEILEDFLKKSLHQLNQGCQTYGPQVRSRPQSWVTWPKASKGDLLPVIA